MCLIKSEKILKKSEVWMYMTMKNSEIFITN